MDTQLELDGLKSFGVRTEVFKAIHADIDDLRATERLDARAEAYAQLALSAAENLGRAYGRGHSAAMLLAEARACLDRLHEVALPAADEAAGDASYQVLLMPVADDARG